MKNHNIKIIKNKLKNAKNFLEYLNILNNIKSSVAIFIAVGDTGYSDFFTENHQKALYNLGLKTNHMGMWRMAYVAIIDHGVTLVDEPSTDCARPVIVDAEYQGHKFTVYSGGYECLDPCGCIARCVFDDIDLWNLARGFHFLVMDDDCNILNRKVIDTYDELKIYDLDSCTIIDESLQQANPGIIYCQIGLPVRLNKSYNMSETEKLICDMDLDMGANPETRNKLWGSGLFPWLVDYEDFEEYSSAFVTPPSYIAHTPGGYRRFADYASKAVNTINGVRITLNQPQIPKRAIFLVGLCTLYGYGSNDINTPASFLQKILNEKISEKGFIVYNYSYIYGYNKPEPIVAELKNILCNLPTKPGDIVFVQSLTVFEPNKDKICNLMYKAIRPHNYGEIHLDRFGHFTKAGNKMIAEGIFEFLEKNDFFDFALTKNTDVDPTNVDKKANEDKDALLTYQNKLIKFYKNNILPKVGSVVMNCNPFTLGHRYLVEEALKKCDYLIIFVVEEDKSEFPFAERFQMVKENLKDLKNVFIFPSGQYIISAKTFEEYFNKEGLQEKTIDPSYDITLFCSKIAPCLNITMRFAGEEPFDNVTRQYNETMKRLLPQYGIEFIEIPRLKNMGETISASKVRSLLKNGKFDEIKNFAPEYTLKYLKEVYSKNEPNTQTKTDDNCGNSSRNDKAFGND